MKLLPSLLGATLLGLLALPQADAQTGVVQFSQTAYTATVSQGVAVIPVLFSVGATDPATVDFVTTSGGTAVAGVSYQAVSNTLDFAVGSLIATGTVTLLNNGLAQSTQTVNLALMNPTGAALLGTPATAVLTIINDSLGQIQFAQATATVDDTDTTAIVTLVCTGITNGTAAVDFSTSNGSAKAGLNYTTTTGTVVFASGVTTNTIAVPILPPSGLQTNQTFNLILSNPTGASLGSPAKTVVTIVATGPPVIQLSAASYKVHEHLGRGTITAIRFGDSSAAATVDYATSDGTAHNLTDYLGTRGTLNFQPGIAQQSFSFQIVKYATFQSNKTVNVSLTNPTGASLGAQRTAVLTIVNDLPQTITFTNASGVEIQLLLRFAGNMAVTQADPLILHLDATDGTSALSISAKHGKASGGSLQIDQITGDGGCRLIDARNFDLVGAGIELGDVLHELRIHDLRNGGSVTATGAATQGTKILAHNIDDNSTLSLGSRLGNLTAARLGDSVLLTAPCIGTITLRGDPHQHLAADCGASVAISGNGLTTNQLALGALTLAGALSNASVVVSNGRVGTIAAGQIIDSTIYIGYEPNDPSNPFTGGGTFADNLRLDSVSVSARSNGFVNSEIAAAIIGTVHLASVRTGNSGQPFGILANGRLAGVSVKSPAFKWVHTGASDQSLGDFHVIK